MGDHGSSKYDSISEAAWLAKVHTPCLPHPELRAHLTDVESEEGFEEAFVDVLVEIPAGLRKVISGGRCLRLRSLKTERFLKQLFHGIADHSPVGVTLKPYDLSHAHVVSTGGDVLLVFHAKEFPREYRHSTVAPVLPVGHYDMGGVHDPRHGTVHSVKDLDYHLRNYIYILSTNTIYLADPAHKSFPSELLSNQEFCTLDEWKLGTVVGDVNYLQGYGVLMAPRHALRWQTRVRHAVGRVQARSSNATSEELSLMDEFSQSIVKLLREDTISLSDSMSELLHLFRTASEEDLECLANGGKVFGFPEGVCATLASYAEDVLGERVESRKHAATKHKEELVGKGVCAFHAEEFLELTSTQHGFSAFRAMQVLEVVHPRYRSDENTMTFGDKSYDVSIASTACRMVYYADSALEALSMHESSGVPLHAACDSVVQRKEELTRMQIKKQQEQQLRRNS